MGPWRLIPKVDAHSGAGPRRSARYAAEGGTLAARPCQRAASVRLPAKWVWWFVGELSASLVAKSVVSGGVLLVLAFGAGVMAVCASWCSVPV